MTRITGGELYLCKRLAGSMLALFLALGGGWEEPKQYQKPNREPNLDLWSRH